VVTVKEDVCLFNKSIGYVIQLTAVTNELTLRPYNLWLFCPVL